jgi:hypothetical protein
MKPKAEGHFYVIAAIGGAALWLGTMAISGRSEAWDSSLYWQAAYPLSLTLAGVLGYFAPERPWRWALAVMLVQPVVMAFTSGGSFGLLPLGLLMFAVLALPAVFVASLGAGFRLRKETR